MEQGQALKGRTIEADFIKRIKEKTKCSNFGWIVAGKAKSKITLRKKDPEPKGIGEIKVINLQKFSSSLLIILIYLNKLHINQMSAAGIDQDCIRMDAGNLQQS